MSDSLRLLTLAISFFLCAAGFAADQPSSSDTVVKFEALLAESKRIEANEPQRAVTLAREALALVAHHSDQIAELKARIRLAEALRLASAYAEAREVIAAGLALPARAGEEIARATLVYNTGQIYWNYGNYALAEKAYVQAQAVAEKMADHVLLVRILNSRGIVARHQRDLKQSMEYYRTALALAETINDTALKLQIQNNFATALIDTGEFEEARRLFRENLAAHTASNNRRSIANALVNLATVESALGNYPLALDYNLRALAVRKETGIPRHIASAQMAVAITLTKLNRTDEALDYLRLTLPSVEKFNSHEFSGNLYTAFSDAHAARGEFREALDFQRKAQLENEIVSGEKTALTVAELRENFDAEKRSREIIDLKERQQHNLTELALRDAEIKTSRVQRYSLLALLAFGGIAVAAVVSRQRAKAQGERIILEETRLARDAAEQANEFKTRLLDLASHDLKTPLVGMMLLAEDIAETHPPAAPQARTLHDEGQRMFHLVQGLLDGSMAEAGMIELDRSTFSFTALASEALTHHAAHATRKNQRIEFTPDPAETPVNADAARMRQVIDNLVDNALKFSSPGTTIRVAVRATQKSVRLEVSDEGPGLSEDDRKKLFQRFSRLSATPTGGESSSGLGLAQAHDFVRLHGGEIRAESSPGHGATFIVELPVG